MKRPLTILLFLSFISLFLCGCSILRDRGDRIIESIEKSKGYSASLDIEFVNDREISHEKGKGSFCKGNVQTIKLKSGKTLSWSEDKVFTKIDENGINHTEIQAEDALYRYVFPGEYIKKIKIGDAKKYFLRTNEGKEYLVVEVSIASENKNLYRGIIYIDTSNYLPQKIIEYDKQGKERVIVEYSNFKKL